MIVVFFDVSEEAIVLLLMHNIEFRIFEKMIMSWAEFTM